MKKLIPFIGLFLLSIFLNAQTGGYALKFDGTDDYVSIPDNASIDFTSSDSYTIEAWVYANTLTSSNIGRAIVSKWKSGDNSYYVRINTGGDIWFDELYTSLGVITTNKWYHIACVYKSGTGAYRKVFVNGVEKTLTGTVLGPNDGNDEPLKIGRHNVYSQDWSGRIDEVRIWNVARTEAEIKANMYKELAGNEAGLAAYYKMSDGQLTTLTDDSQNDNTGTLTNDPTWVASGCFTGSRNTLTFDGTDDYVDCGNSSLFNMSNSLTIEAWVNINNTTNGMFVAGKFEHGSSSEGYGLFVNSHSLGGGAGKISFIAGQSWSAWWGITSNSTIPINTWNHIAGIFDGRYLKIYINGNLDGITDLGSNKAISNSTYNFSIGKRIFEDTDKFNGKIDEVRIWNTARTESQIRENMMKNLVGNEPGLVAYYRFDEYRGTTLYDLTNNGYNGTLTNMGATPTWATSTAFNTWIGGESNNWATAANWSNGVPVATDNVGLYKWDLNSITTYDVLNNSDLTTNSLFISSTSNPTLPTTFTVNGSFVIEKI